MSAALHRMLSAWVLEGAEAAADALLGEPGITAVLVVHQLHEAPTLLLKPRVPVPRSAHAPLHRQPASPLSPLALLGRLTDVGRAMLAHATQCAELQSADVQSADADALRGIHSKGEALEVAFDDLVTRLTAALRLSLPGTAVTIVLVHCVDMQEHNSAASEGAMIDNPTPSPPPPPPSPLLEGLSAAFERVKASSNSGTGAVVEKLADNAQAAVVYAACLQIALVLESGAGAGAGRAGGGGDASYEASVGLAEHLLRREPLLLQSLGSLRMGAALSSAAPTTAAVPLITQLRSLFLPHRRSSPGVANASSTRDFFLFMAVLLILQRLGVAYAKKLSPQRLSLWSQALVFAYVSLRENSSAVPWEDGQVVIDSWRGCQSGVEEFVRQAIADLPPQLPQALSARLHAVDPTLRRC